ncbi:unnamed protein product, partial [Timema podura]|nr:unnamed protein product [Timema podura]
EGKSGRTPLHYAIESRNATVILYLLEDCPPGPNGLQLETTTYSGFTAYQLAACLDASLAHRLAEKGALALNTPDLDSEVDSDFDEDEIYRKTSVDYYTAHKMNGGPIDISA